MPIDGQKKLEGALLGGEPSAFYFKSDISEKINNVEGVDKVSPQVYIASLSASCCSFPVQVIGIDFESDFFVTPWLQGQVDDLESGEVLVGANIFGEKGDQIILYNDYLLLKNA